MNVLFISEYFPPRAIGGGELSCFLLAKYLAQQKVTVTVLTSHFKGLAQEETLPGTDGVRVLRYLTTGYSPENFFSNVKRELFFPCSVKKQLLQLLKRESFDILHYFNTTSILGKLCQNETRAKQIMHVNSPVVFCPMGTLLYTTQEAYKHRKNFWNFVNSFVHADEFGKMKNHWYYRYNPLLMLYLFYSFKRRNCAVQGFDHYIAVSPFMQQLLEEEGITQNNISIVPNIVEPEKQMAAQTSHRSKKKRIKRILYLGLFMKNKGVYVLLEALQKLTLLYECTFYGDGPEKEALLDYVRHNQLPVTINAPVPSDEILTLLSQYDVLVFPSLIPESFGRLVVESQTVGTVVIASRIGGTQYLIEHEKTGYLFTPGNAEELSRLLHCVLTQKQTAIIHRAQHSAQQYRGTVVAQKMIDVYRLMTIT